MTALEKAKYIAKILDSKLGHDIKVLHIGDLTSIGDYFVIAHGNSDSQLKALTDAVDEKMSQNGMEPNRIEGYNSNSWVLMDYHDVIVQIFIKETREFYALEKLWGDAPEVPLDF